MFSFGLQHWTSDGVTRDKSFENHLSSYQLILRYIEAAWWGLLKTSLKSKIFAFPRCKTENQQEAS